MIKTSWTWPFRIDLIGSHCDEFWIVFWIQDIQGSASQSFPCQYLRRVFKVFSSKNDSRLPVSATGSVSHSEIQALYEIVRWYRHSNTGIRMHSTTYWVVYYVQEKTPNSSQQHHTHCTVVMFSRAPIDFHHATTAAVSACYQRSVPFLLPCSYDYNISHSFAAPYPLKRCDSRS